MININREYIPTYNNVFKVIEYDKVGYYYVDKNTAFHIWGDEIDISDLTYERLSEIYTPDVLSKTTVGGIDTQGNKLVEEITELYEIEPSAVSICKVQNEFEMFLVIGDDFRIPIKVYEDDILDSPILIVDTTKFDYWDILDLLTGEE